MSHEPNPTDPTDDAPANLSGHLLVATPALQDPFFRRTILLLSHHSPQDGALGLVLNRPLKLDLGELAPEAGPLKDVPLFYGGPVQADQPVLAGLRWGPHDQVDLQSFGDVDTSAHIPPEWQPHLRLFVGHSGWSPGQLEGEIEQKSWFVLRPVREIIEHPHPAETWRFLLRHMNPLMKLLAEAPENPDWN